MHLIFGVCMFLFHFVSFLFCFFKNNFSLLGIQPVLLFQQKIFFFWCQHHWSHHNIHKQSVYINCEHLLSLIWHLTLVLFAQPNLIIIVFVWCEICYWCGQFSIRDCSQSLGHISPFFNDQYENFNWQIVAHIMISNDFLCDHQKRIS